MNPLAKILFRGALDQFEADAIAVFTLMYKGRLDRLQAVKRVAHERKISKQTIRAHCIRAIIEEYPIVGHGIGEVTPISRTVFRLDLYPSINGISRS